MMWILSDKLLGLYIYFKFLAWAIQPASTLQGVAAVLVFISAAEAFEHLGRKPRCL